MKSITVIALAIFLSVGGCAAPQTIQLQKKYPFTHTHSPQGKHTHIFVEDSSPDQKQRYFSEDSGSGFFLGYDDNHERIFGSK